MIKDDGKTKYYRYRKEAQMCGEMMLTGKDFKTSRTNHIT